jgi:hypothetical protein
VKCCIINLEKGIKTTNSIKQRPKNFACRETDMFSVTYPTIWHATKHTSKAQWFLYATPPLMLKFYTLCMVCRLFYMFIVRISYVLRTRKTFALKTQRMFVFLSFVTDLSIKIFMKTDTTLLVFSQQTEFVCSHDIHKKQRLLM